jgi:mannose-6-phosphate isomerase-like protein (cupin superfamily)
MTDLCEATDWASDGFLVDIEALSVEGTDFRRVLYTTKRSQLVVMALKPWEDIGMETHEDNDQFIRCEDGVGTVTLNGKMYPFVKGNSVTIPAGTKHNIIGHDPGLKLYTIYSPPHHRDGVRFETKADAQASTEKFDGVTTAERT